jgi:hypothetical protein
LHSWPVWRLASWRLPTLDGSPDSQIRFRAYDLHPNILPPCDGRRGARQRTWRGLGKYSDLSIYLFYQYIYNEGTSNTKFIPVLLEGANESDIPVPWQVVNFYRPFTATGYEELYRRLTNQPIALKPILGKLQQLPPSERKNDLIDTKPEIKVLCCYAHHDKRFRDTLEVSLRNLKKQIQITAWSDLDINLEGREEYKNAADLYTADVILLLVSPNFMATDFSYSIEMKRAMERQEAREALVIPLIIFPTDWEYTPLIRCKHYHKTVNLLWNGQILTKPS